MTMTTTTTMMMAGVGCKIEKLNTMTYTKGLKQTKLLYFMGQ
jgi:hypothetical protein